MNEILLTVIMRAVLCLVERMLKAIYSIIICRRDEYRYSVVILEKV